MGGWSTQRQGIMLLGGLFLLGEAVLAMQTGWIAWLGGITMSLILIGGVLVLATRADRRLGTSLEALEQAVLRMSNGDFEEPVAPPSAPEIARIAGALEHTRKRVAKHFDDLVKAKVTLSDELAQARELLRDPVVERRRVGVERLGMTAEILVAGTSHPVGLVDFWLDQVVVALDRSFAKELAPGQPVIIRFTTPDGMQMEDDATVHGPTRGRQGPRVEWVFQWAQTIAPADLWPPLWHAVNPRTELRVCVPPEASPRAILHINDTSYQARVLDMSKGGVGIEIDVSMETLGLVGHGALAALTLELPEDRTIKERVWVRGVDARPETTRLGLALEGLDPTTGAALAAFLVEIQQYADLEEAPMQFGR